MSRTMQLTSATLFACAVYIASANEFLKATPKELHESLSEEGIRNTLLEEIESTFGTGTASKRIEQLEVQLKPIFQSLPKNEYGRLGHTTVRYALHRLFVLRHGWNIKGLGANGSTWNSSSPTSVLKDQVPAYIQDMFERRLGGKGFGMHELTVLAATIEHLIHTEVLNKLGDVYTLLGYLPTSTLTEEEGYEVLDTYMMAYILGEGLTNITRSDALALVQQMPSLFLGWTDTQKFVREIRERLAGNSSNDNHEGLDFTMLSNTLEVIGEEFGTFQDAECRTLKDSLMKMEDRTTGRVKIADFYKPALSGNWQFQESIGYLRQVGALDASGSQEPSVIITNYLYSQANCIASSGFYSVCCKDECEGLLGHLEEKIAAPDAKPARILGLVSNLQSSTVSAPRNLSTKMVDRLNGIAEHHGGVVPLHGRLFAQWMHHVFPHECPFPHLSGTTSQTTSAEWDAESGISATATEEEMGQFVDLTDPTSIREFSADEEITEWSHEEELLVVRTSTSKVLRMDLSSLPPLVRSSMLLVAASALGFGLVQSFKVSLAAPADTSKFVV